jgi:hypothetical protein
MSIPFTCPHCGARTKVSEEYAGQTGPCTRCGKTITIPPLQHAVLNLAADRRRSIIRAAAAVAAIIVAVLLFARLVLWPLVLSDRENTRGLACAENLKQIGQALLMYHAKYGRFPPAYVADSQGRPMHSWRVLLLPFLNEEALYRQYRFQEPWNSPRNSTLASRMPAVYHCPSDLQQSDSGATQTSYVAITGPGTVFDGVKPENFPGGPGRVILVAEQSASGIIWLEPRDMDVNRMSMHVNDPTADEAIRSQHIGEAHVLVCSGEVFSLDDDTEPQQLEDMLTISGGEQAWLTPDDRKSPAVP